MTSERPILDLTDIETAAETTADALARAGYRTVWDVYRARETDLASDVDQLNRATAGYLKSGIGRVDPEQHRFRVHVAPDEEAAAVAARYDPPGNPEVSLVDEQEWGAGPETTTGGPNDYEWGPGMATTTGGLDADQPAATTRSSHSVVEWPDPADDADQSTDPDPLVRRPARLGAGIAVLVTIAVGGLLAISLGLPAAFGAGLVTASLLAGAFWALTREQTWHVVVGSVTLIVSSIAFLGALAFAVRAGSGSIRPLVSLALIVGSVAIGLDLSVGLGRAVRRHVATTLLGISLAVPVALAPTLALASPAVAGAATSLSMGFDAFITDPGTGLAPFGLLLIEGGLLFVGIALLRTRVPASVVPSPLRRVFERDATSIAEAVGHGWYTVLVGVWFPLGLVAAAGGMVIETPTGVTGYGEAVFSVTNTALTAAWLGGRVHTLHWLGLFGLGALVVLRLCTALWNRVVATAQRRAAFLSTLGYVLVLTVVVLATPLVPDVVEPMLDRLASQYSAVVALSALYRALGPPATVLLGSYLGVVVIVFLLYSVAVLETVRIVPDGVSGVALGCAHLSAGAILAGLAGAPALAVFGGLAGTLYVWDVGQYATELGSRLGRSAETKRAELSHAVGSISGLGLAVGLPYAGYRLTSTYTLAGSRPQLVLGLFLSLGGTLALLFSLRS